MSWDHVLLSEGIVETLITGPSNPHVFMLASYNHYAFSLVDFFL